MARFLVATLMTDPNEPAMHLANVDVVEIAGRSTAAGRREIAAAYIDSDPDQRLETTVLVIQIDSSVAPEAFRLRPTTVLDQFPLPGPLEALHGPAEVTP